MWNLIYKDLFLQKKGLIFAVFYCIFIIFTFQDSEVYIQQVLYINAALIMIYVLQFLSISKEDKTDSYFFLNSLPLKRIQIVSATYLYGLVLTAVILFILAASGLFWNAFFFPVELIKVPIILITFLLSALLSSIYIPVYFKVKNAHIAKVIVFAVIFFIIYSLPGIFKHFTQTPDSYLIQNLLAIVNNTGVWLIWATAIIITAFITLLSWTISLKIYMNKDF